MRISVAVGSGGVSVGVSEVDEGRVVEEGGGGLVSNVGEMLGGGGGAVGTGGEGLVGFGLGKGDGQGDVLSQQE